MGYKELEDLFKEYLPKKILNQGFVVNLYDIYEISCWIKYNVEKLSDAHDAEHLEDFLVSLDVQLYSHLNNHVKPFKSQLKSALKSF